MSVKLRLVLLIIFGLLLAALFSQNAALIWMAFPFLFYLGAGLLSAPEEVHLRTSRTVTPARGEADTPITMTVTVQNEGPGVPLLRLYEATPSHLRVTQGPVERFVHLPAGGQAGLRYTFKAPRGHYDWDTLQVTASDPFGLFEITQDLPAAAEALVLPDRLPMRRLRLRPRETLHTAGMNLSRLPGAGIDFYGVREYHSGDSLRWVHWRLSARHPRTFFSKEFEREEMADIGLILDGSAALNLHNGKEDLFEYSVDAAAALAQKILSMGNRLSMLLLCEPVVRIFPGAGKRHLIHIQDKLAGCRPGEKISLNALKYLPVKLFPSHSLVIVISPMRGDDFPAIARLRASGYQVLLVSPDPVQFACREARHPLAVQAAQLERKALLWRIREIGVQVIDWPVDQPLLKMTDSFYWSRR